MSPSCGRLALLIAAAAGLASPALAQLRVANWNVSTYPSTHQAARDAAFEFAIYTAFSGRVFAPDVLCGEEFNTAQGVTDFKAMLNGYTGGPTDWDAATFTSGPDTQSAFFFRSSKVTYLGKTLVISGDSSANSTQPPRNVWRYDIRLAGYSNTGATVACYAVHMKSGSSSGAPTEDQERRLVEAAAIRANSNALPAGWHFLIAGDFNIQTNTQAAYKELVDPTPPSAVIPATTRGQFFDPIKSPGSWNNNGTWKFIHTQAPCHFSAPNNSGGMDDRFDIILLDSALIDTAGFDYIGNANIQYSQSAWNDLNHSYRCWGNDGTSFNGDLTIVGNTMVGQDIAQALVDTAQDDGPGGHLPVYLDLRVPALVSAPSTLNLGNINQNDPGQTTLPVSNGGNVALWNASGIASLQYSLAASSGVTAPGGAFSAAPGAPANNHTISINTSTPGPFSGTVTINPTSADTPAFQVTVTATIVAPAVCYANCDASTTPPIVNTGDFTCFLQQYSNAVVLPGAQQQTHYANCDGSTTFPQVNTADFTCFLQKYAAGCS